MSDLPDEPERRDIPVPSIEEVLRRLGAGTTVRVGGGRFYQTYFADGDRLRCRTFDEGETYVEDIEQSELESVVRRYPEEFSRG